MSGYHEIFHGRNFYSLQYLVLVVQLFTQSGQQNYSRPISDLKNEIVGGATLRRMHM